MQQPPLPKPNPRERVSTPNNNNITSTTSSSGVSPSHSHATTQGGVTGSETSKAPPSVPTCLSDPKTQPKEGDDEEEGPLLNLFLTLSAKTPKPSQEEAREVLKKAYWVIDWALCLEKVDLAAERHAALTTRLQQASEGSSTNLKHLKFLQNNLYAQLEESNFLKTKLAEGEEKRRYLATEAQVAKAESARLLNSNADLNDLCTAKDEEIMLLRAELQAVNEKVAVLTLQRPQQGSSTSCETTSATNACPNCVILNNRMKEELSRYQKQEKESEARCRRVEYDAEQKITKEVETMLRQLQEFYRSTAGR